MLAAELGEIGWLLFGVSGYVEDGIVDGSYGIRGVCQKTIKEHL